MAGDPHTPDSDTSTGPPAGQPGADLAMLLTGDLPCIGCGYDIRGLSVLAPCPECGLAVRATILHRVDPQADALRPMPTPWVTSIGILVWTAAGLLAALVLWTPRVVDLIEEFTGGRLAIPAEWAGPLAVALAIASGAGLVGLIRPTVGLPPVRAWMAVLAMGCYVPIGVGVYCLSELSRVGVPYLSAGPSPERIGCRLLVSASACAMLLLIRPNAREMVYRSLVLRTKRVDRQTIFATVGALAVTVVGDLLRLASTAGGGRLGWLGDLGSLVVLIGSVLVTMAIAGATRDAWRIAHSILTPSPSPTQALRRGVG